MTRAREFNQTNLVPISKRDFRKIEIAIERNNLLSFSQGTHQSGDITGWRMKTKQDTGDKYLLVSHFTIKEAGGLNLEHKADKELLLAFEKMTARTQP